MSNNVDYLRRPISKNILLITGPGMAGAPDPQELAAQLAINGSSVDLLGDGRSRLSLKSMVDSITHQKEPSLIIVHIHGRSTADGEHYIKNRFGQSGLLTEDFFKTVAAVNTVPHDYIVSACSGASADAGFVRAATKGSALVSFSNKNGLTNLDNFEDLLRLASRDPMLANGLSANRMLNSFLVNRAILSHEPTISVAGVGTWDTIKMLENRKRRPFSREEHNRIQRHLLSGAGSQEREKIEAAVRAIERGTGIGFHIHPALAVALAAANGTTPIVPFAADHKETPTPTTPPSSPVPPGRRGPRSRLP